MIRGAVLGSPISHSLSPVLHKAAFDFFGLEGSYEAIEVGAGSLADFFQSESQNFDYFSLTMPLKEEALSIGIPFCERVEKVQSANTLYKFEGDWRLETTDGIGLIKALDSLNVLRRERVLILGAGGTARAVAGSLDGLAKKIVVMGRSRARETVIASAVTNSDFLYTSWVSDPNFNSYDLVVNTTPAGAADLLADSVVPGVQATLFDVIYKPWPTVLARRWSDCGGQVVNGAELLIHQGISQLELVTGLTLDRSVLADHLREVLSKHLR